MYRLLILATGALAGCGTIECDEDTFTCTGGDNNMDDRPLTLEYVQVTVLRPYCANAQCHSAFSYTSEYRFDTIAHTRDSMLQNQLVVPGNADDSFVDGGSFLCCGPGSVLTRDTDPTGEAPRMPYDQPLPTSEIALIKEWINADADGLQ